MGLGVLSAERLFLFRQCPDSACKQDLLAYLQRIALYCHQLNICSKVKAEVQNLGGELVVSGVSVSDETHWPGGVCWPVSVAEVDICPCASPTYSRRGRRSSISYKVLLSSS